jgi:TP901 family phage tail tape measure protein
MAERVVRVSLTAQVSNYVAGMEQAARATDKSSKAAADAKARYEEQNRAMESVGRGMVVAGALAVTASALAAKAAIGWQSAWTGVTKTVEGTPEQLAEVEAGLRGLTKVLPAAHDEIAAVAEAAGQLGIQTGSVVAFTKTMIDLGETTNLSADEAATSLARFMNVMGTSQDQVSNLGSAVVELGNNYATTEAEIVQMSQRLSGAGRQIGLSEGEVLGLATALSSVGIEAEAGGSAISKVMIDIASSVDKGGDRLELFAKTAGVSAEDFAKKWESEPGAALALFVEGLSNAEAQGTSTLGVLENLGITEVRMRDALLRSAAASDQFTEAMDTGNAAFKENNALTEEAAKRYSTVEAKLEITRNKVVDAAIDFGQVFLPVVSAMADAVGGLADGFSALPAPLKGTVAGVTALSGVVLLAGGAFLLAVPKIAEFSLALTVLSTSQIPAVAGAAVRMQGAIAASSVAMGKSVRFLLGPWGIALAAAAVTIGVLDKAIKAGVPTAEGLANALETSATAADLLYAASRRSDTEQFFWGDYNESLKELPELLNKATNDGAQDWLNLTLNQQGALDSLKRVGDQLGTLASTDAPAAAKQFRSLAESQNLSKEQQRKLLDAMPAYKAALVEQASGLGINVTSTDEAANSNELLKLAFKKVVPSALDAADAYLAAADESAGFVDKLRTLIDTINEANGVGQDAVTANNNYQNALADVDEQIRKATEGLDENEDGVADYTNTLNQATQAGRDNEDLLVDLASKSQAAAEAQHDLDGKTDNYKTTLEAGRKAVIDRALALGATAEEAENLADKIYAIPSEAEFTMIAETSGAEAALERIKAAMNYINNTTPKIEVEGGNRVGFATGGYTGDAPADAPVGFVHGKEWVSTARTTAIPENRRALEYMHRGGVIRGYAQGGYVSGRDVQYASRSGGGGFAAAGQSRGDVNSNIQITTVANDANEVADLVSARQNFELRKLR